MALVSSSHQCAEAIAVLVVNVSPAIQQQLNELRLATIASQH
jgi:hypothetical protein